MSRESSLADSSAMQHCLYNFYTECSISPVQPSDLDEFAHIMMSSYLATAAYSLKFKNDFDSPPTALAKAHHLRSVVQAQIAESERYELHKEYVEFGRVEVTDLQTQVTLLLRSASAVAIESAQSEWTLFDVKPTREVTLLIYKFDRSGLALSKSATAFSTTSRRRLPSGNVQPIGFWRFDDTPAATPTFDQGASDPFGDLGNPDIEAQGGDSQ